LGVVVTDLGVVVTDLGVVVTDLGVVVTDLGVVVTDLGVVVTDLRVVVTDLRVVATDLGEMASEKFWANRIRFEVVSTNWRDDYYDKFRDYEQMGIPEYWIIDYTAIGGKRFTGNPKQKTITICELVEGDYQMTVFRGNNLIASPLFPQLNLTAQQIFDSAL
jgi:hypothetical protein